MYTSTPVHTLLHIHNYIIFSHPFTLNKIARYLLTDPPLRIPPLFPHQQTQF